MAKHLSRMRSTNVTYILHKAGLKNRGAINKDYSL